MGQEAARKTNIILREVVKNGYLAVRLTVRSPNGDLRGSSVYIWGTGFRAKKKSRSLKPKK